jgi:hypothetical protein
MSQKGTTDRWLRIELLRRDLHTLRERYGRIPVDVSMSERLDTQLERKRYRISHLRDQIASLQAEIDQIEQEVGGYLAGVEALLSDAIDRTRRIEGEGWSPVAILGYRMWNVVDGALTGVVQPWRSLTKKAACLNGLHGEDLPHSHGHCGPPACGVYATKQPETIYSQMPRQPDWAIGVVELSGKVVEHSKGYRAQRATLMALWLVVGDKAAPIEGEKALGRALADPPGAVDNGATRRSNSTEYEDACRFLAGWIERRTSWTSENRSA